MPNNAKNALTAVPIISDMVVASAFTYGPASPEPTSPNLSRAALSAKVMAGNIITANKQEIKIYFIFLFIIAKSIYKLFGYWRGVCRRLKRFAAQDINYIPTDGISRDNDH